MAGRSDKFGWVSSIGDLWEAFDAIYEKQATEHAEKLNTDLMRISIDPIEQADVVRAVVLDSMGAFNVPIFAKEHEGCSVGFFDIYGSHLDYLAVDLSIARVFDCRANSPRDFEDGHLTPNGLLNLIYWHAFADLRLAMGVVTSLCKPTSKDTAVYVFDDVNENGNVVETDVATSLNEVLLVMGTPSECYVVNGNINVKTLVVLGCSLIVNGDVIASDHIYAYCRSFAANKIQGGIDTIFATSFEYKAYKPADKKHSYQKIGLDSFIDNMGGNAVWDNSGLMLNLMFKRGWISSYQRDVFKEKLFDICHAADSLYNQPVEHEPIHVVHPQKRNALPRADDLAQTEITVATASDDYKQWLLDQVYLSNKPRPEFLKFVAFSLDPNAFKNMPTTPDEDMIWMSSVIIKASRDPEKQDAVLQAIIDACKSFGIKYKRAKKA